MSVHSERRGDRKCRTPDLGRYAETPRRTNRMLSRLKFGSLVGAAACEGAPASSASSPTLDLDAIPLTAHEAAMRLAITAAKANPLYPFGAVIIGAADRAVLAQGVNNSKTNPTLHGEIVAINDYIARHGRSRSSKPQTRRLRNNAVSARRMPPMIRPR